MVTRYTQFLYKSIVISALILFGIVGSTIDSKAQTTITPKYMDCWPLIENFVGCQTITEQSKIIPYMGCDVEIFYIIRVCTFGNMEVRHIEMQRFEVEETTPPCGLINYIYNSSPAPFGSINEVHFREVVQELYFRLSDSLTLPGLRNVPPFLLGAYGHLCDEFGKPQHGQVNFQAFEGTCMAYCAIKYQVQQFSGPDLYKIRWSYNWNKCADKCCKLMVSYCWDLSASPNPKWRRTFVRGPIGGPTADDCSNYNSTENCQSRYIGDPRYQVLQIFSGTCEETCDDDTGFKLVE